jgi:hypothetical protein
MVTEPTLNILQNALNYSGKTKEFCSSKWEKGKSRQVILFSGYVSTFFIPLLYV